MGSKEDFWNNKYPKATIVYKGRWLRNYGVMDIDVRNFFVNPDSSELQRIIKDWKNLSDDEKALKCQEWVIKNISYVSDKSQFGLEEFWEFPYETLHTKKGDCDDGSILMANLMLASGIPYWKIRLTAGMVPDGGHAYVTYFCEEKDYWVACDWCYLPDTKPIELRPDYKESNIYREVWFSWNQKYSFYGGVKAGEVKFKKEKEIFFKKFKILI